MASLTSVSGIYALHNPQTQRFYVGSSTNVAHRWRQHRHDLRHGKHANQRLQRAWARDGEGAWVFVLIGVLPPGDIMPCEDRLLARLVDHPDCYNINRSATSGRTGIPHTLEARAKMNVMAGKKHPPETIARMLETWAAKRVSNPPKRDRRAEHVRAVERKLLAAIEPLVPKPPRARKIRPSRKIEGRGRAEVSERTRQKISAASKRWHASLNDDEKERRSQNAATQLRSQWAALPAAQRSEMMRAIATKPRKRKESRWPR